MRTLPLAYLASSTTVESLIRSRTPVRSEYNLSSYALLLYSESEDKMQGARCNQKHKAQHFGGFRVGLRISRVERSVTWMPTLSVHDLSTHTLPMSIHSLIVNPQNMYLANAAVEIEPGQLPGCF